MNIEYLMKKIISRTKKTAYEIENEAYDYFFKIRYYDKVKKDEMQAYITRSLIEYNSLYFSTINETIRASVTIVVLFFTLCQLRPVQSLWCFLSSVCC